MTNPAQLINVIEAKCRILTQKNDEYPDLVETSAQAERNYKSALSKIVLDLKLEGHPVTLILKIADGKAADLKFKWDVSAAIVKANIESCKSIITQIDSARSILSFLKQELGGR